MTKVIDFRTDPSRYRHWRVEYDGDVANLYMDVDENGGLFDGYLLKLNSYDLGVDIELADIVQRMRFEHPEVKVVVMRSGKDRVFCAGANIRMLGGASHAHKVNFCKFTNETRNTFEAAEADSGQKYICAVKGSCAGGGYELALACNYIMLTDDSTSSVALPEVPLLAVLPGTGGVSAVRFTADGEIADAYRILEGSTVNCAGGPTPWGTWLSCEEYDWHGNRDATEAFGSVAGRVFETDPTGSTDPVVLPALGLFQHEAAAVDPVNECVYMTEDQPDGCLYRFVPDSYPSLGSGRLEVALLEAGTLTWEEVPDPSATSEPTKDQVPGAARFDGGEGLWYHDGTVVFATKGDNRVHAVDAATGAYRVIYDADDLGGDAPLRGVDNLTVEPGSGDVYVAEDGGNMEVVIITPSGEVAPFARVVGHEGSEVTGPVFSPDGSRLYFSSQRGSDGRGVTFEVSGPFRGAVDAIPSETTTTVVDSIESASASARTADAGSGGIDPPLVAGAAAAALAAGGIGVLLRRRGRGAVGRGDD